MSKHYDVIIVGGGSAGLMAAVGASEHGAKVLLLEKGDRLGRKLIISGGGRCNVTNAKDIDGLIQNIPGNGRFMYSAFHQFSNRDIIRFFERLGVALKEEDNGRMFPVNDRAITVANSLIEYIRSKDVEIRYRTKVTSLFTQDQTIQGVITDKGEKILSKAVIIATGGMSVPKTGSTGDGYQLAKQVGHTITPLYPTEVPLTSDEDWIVGRNVQGVSLRDVTLSLYTPKAKQLTRQRGDMIFTHFGVSGPAALRVGHYVSVAKLKNPTDSLTLKIDLFPDVTVEDLSRKFQQHLAQESKKTIKNVMRGQIPERLIPIVLQKAGVDEELTSSHISKKQVVDLITICKGLPIHITGTLTIEEAFVTGGGISTKEIDPKTFSSKIVHGLYFAGEVMDVHGHTGGYNITVAFSSGYIAGSSAAKLRD